MRCLSLTMHLVVTVLLASSVQAGAEAPEAVTPTAPIKLLQGNSLAGWTTWLQGSGTEDAEGVFSVREGVLYVSGAGRGYVATETAYRDYHLTAEYKWGTRTDGGKYVRNSGILLHGTGPHGSAGGLWMTSIEVQLAQGCEGDFIVIRGRDERGDVFPATISSHTILERDRRTRWSKTGTKTVFAGKQFWWSNHDPDFQELLDTRGKHDEASPLGEWTKVECLCAGDRISIRINGKTVNECFDVRPASGKILLQNEGFEVFFRNVELRPLSEARP